MRAKTVGVIGVPTSAGAFAPGQEQAPEALREAGLLDRLGGRGRRGSRSRRPGGLALATGSREPSRAERSRRSSRSCGHRSPRRATRSPRTARRRSCSAATARSGSAPSPATSRAGSASGSSTSTRTRISTCPPACARARWTGWAWPTCSARRARCRSWSAAGPRAPLLEPEQVLLFGWGPEQATPFERDVDRPPRDRGPPGRRGRGRSRGRRDARSALIEERCDRVLVHFDVDVIDFTDVPLSENWGRNEGLSYEHALRALGVLLASPRLAGLTITELNPDHAERGAGSIERFTEAVAQSLTDALRPRRPRAAEGLSRRPGCPPRAGTPARSARRRPCRGSTRRRTGPAPRRTPPRARSASAFAAGGDRRAVARLEVLAVVARALEGGDLQHVALAACGSRRGRRTARRTCSSLPHSGGGWAPGGGGGANGPIVRNSAPIMPSGVQLSSPIVPPGRQTRTSSSATSWWWGANIAPIDDMTTSNDSSSNGRFSASASTHSSVDALGLGAAAAGLEQLGRQVAGGDVRAGLRRRDRGVAGAGGDVEDVASPGRSRRPRRAAARAAAGTSRPSTGSRPTPTSRDGVP